MQYAITELAPPSGLAPGTSTGAMAVTQGGSAVGYYLSPGVGEQSGRGAALQWTSADTIVLGGETDQTETALDVSDQGIVVGHTGFGVFSWPEVWHTYGSAEDLTQLLTPYGQASGVNENGQVTGFVGDGVSSQTFIYDANGGGVTMLDPPPGHQNDSGAAINDAGHVVGTWRVEDGDHLFLFRDGGYDDLGPGSAGDLNSGDQVTGGIFFEDSAHSRACRIDASGISLSGPSVEDLGHSPLPGYDGSYGLSINDDGVVVGYSFSSWSPDLFDRAFVDVPGDGPDAGFHDLQPLVVNGDGWELRDACDINIYGTIVGWGTYNGLGRGFQLEPYTPSGGLPEKFKKFPDEVLAFLFLFGGVERGAPGRGVTFGGKPIPIPPHEWKTRWEAMSEAEKDLRIGLAAEQLAALMSDSERARVIKSAGQDVVERTRAELRLALSRRAEGPPT